MVFTKPRGSYNELLTCISSKCKECCLYDDKVFLLSQIINTNGKKSFASDFKTHSDKQAHQKPFLIDLFSARRFSSAQFSRSVVSDSLKPMNRSTPGLPVHHHLSEFTQTHVHRVGDAIYPTHPLSSPFAPAPNSSQHQSLFQ